LKLSGKDEIASIVSVRVETEVLAAGVTLFVDGLALQLAKPRIKIKISQRIDFKLGFYERLRLPQNAQL
jgi:hypothetical protein